MLGRFLIPTNVHVRNNICTTNGYFVSINIFPDEVACVEQDECLKYCGNKVGCSNIAYPKLVLEILPSGNYGPRFIIPIIVLLFVI